MPQSTSERDVRPAGAPARPRNAPAAPTSRQELIALQAAAGNRAVRSLLAEPTVQRHLGPTLESEVTPAPETGTGTTTKAGSGTGTGTATAKGAKALSRRDQVQEQMKATEAGRWALDVIAKNAIKVVWEYEGTGSLHDSGTIYLNKSLIASGAAVVMMHEAQHALTWRSGKAAKVDKLSREAWIAAKIADEAEAAVRSIEGAAAMFEAGTSIAGSGINAGIIDQYQEALGAEVTKQKAADSKLSATEAAARARTIVRDGKVTGWFYDGTFKTSTEKLTYMKNYGDQWDKAHAPPATAMTAAKSPSPEGDQ